MNKLVIGEWLLVKGEVAPFGPIVYAFGEETTHHSTTHHSTKVVHRLHRLAQIIKKKSPTNYTNFHE